MLSALDDAATALSERSRPEAMRLILREWLQANGYLAK
ncbi:hypothetical protein MPLA_140344 [Mesorhizobium sp. ORS 3359]|nr:hypothetical protein MPLA_140344 [Mesorhizobium sp. ORS 3359]